MLEPADASSANQKIIKLHELYNPCSGAKFRTRRHTGGGASLRDSLSEKEIKE
jgi:hypothetical protein